MIAGGTGPHEMHCTHLSGPRESLEVEDPAVIWCRVLLDESNTVRVLSSYPYTQRPEFCAHTTQFIVMLSMQVCSSGYPINTLPQFYISSSL